MAKADLGDKQVCPSCGAKFYDLGRRPAMCPKCQTAFDPQDEAVRMKRVRTRAPAYDDDETSEKPEVETEEEEAVETPEIDAAALEAPPEGVEGEEEEEGPANSDEIPAGFSEDVGEDETAVDDDAVPILEDEEEEFPEDELGEIGGDGEEEPT